MYGHSGISVYGYGGKATREEEDGVWTTELAEQDDGYCEHHEHLEEGASTVVVQPKVIRRVLGLCFLHPDTEFLVYLRGEWPDDGQPVARDIYVPHQEVSVANVTREQPPDEEVPSDIIGALHKHPGTGAQRFSGIDDDSLNVNHDISLVIPEDGALRDWRGEVRHRLECGCTDTRKAKVRFNIIDDELREASQERVHQRRTKHANGGDADRSIH